MTPLLAPLLDYDLKGGQLAWRDSNALAQVQSISIYQPRNEKAEVPRPGNWMKGEFCNLADWQAFYEDNTNYPGSISNSDPGPAVLAALKKYDYVLTELRSASERPYSVFPVHYQDGSGLLVAHLGVLKSLSQLTQLHALASLAAGRSGDALADVKLGLFLVQSIRVEPILISQLVRVSMFQLMLQPVWEGQVKHQWDEGQLQELQKVFSSFDFLYDYGEALRGERAFSFQGLNQMRQGGLGSNPVPKWLRTLLPTGWLYQNQRAVSVAFAKMILPIADAKKRRVYPELVPTNGLVSVLGTRTPYNVFAYSLLPALERSTLRFAVAQESLDLATVGCGLERFRLAHKQLPENLSELSPQFLTNVPVDAMDGAPLRYRKQSNTSYLLYSVGWDQKDDAGAIGITKSKTPRPDLARGDWAWICP